MHSAHKYIIYIQTRRKYPYVSTATNVEQQQRQKKLFMIARIKYNGGIYVF